MAASIGRDITMTVGGSALLGLREKNMTYNGEPINITSEEDAGYQILLSDVGEGSISIDVAGIDKDDVLRTAAAALTRANLAVVITYETGGTLTGNFKVSSYSEGIPYQEAATFSATLMSNGAYTFTPPA